jgi:hypothetical protein
MYVGQDRTDTVNYTESVDSPLTEVDCSARDHERREHYSLSKEILWEWDTAADAEVSVRLRSSSSDSVEQTTRRFGTTVGHGGCAR